MGYYDDELMHYGVKGMKWGVRRRSDQQTFRQASKKARADGLEARKAARNSGQLNGIGAIRKGNKIQRDAAKASLKEQKQVSKAAKITPEAIAERKAKQKKAIKIGAAVAGTALVAYGTYKATQYIKSEAGKRSYESGKKYAQEHFFSKANISNPNKYLSLQEAGRRTLQNTDKRTKQVSSSTIEAVKYLRRPERYQVDGDLMRWH